MRQSMRNPMPRQSSIRALLAGLMVFLASVAPSMTYAAQSITYYHWDALGSPVAASDEAGNLKWREEYKPYGEKIKNETAAQSNTRWFTGHPHDNATGLTYMGARWYDPVVGRFMAIDPADFSEGNPQGFNRYAYGNNNPYKFVDPDGRLPIIPWIIGAGLFLYDVFSPSEPVPGHPDAIQQVSTLPGPVGGIRAAAKVGNEALKHGDDVTKSGVHKNSLDYVGDTHVYRVKGPDGSTYKIGESAQGTRVGDGASIRAEQQARRLTRETGDTYTSEIRKTFPDKASARDYETRVIERFRRMYGDDALPGNKTNR